MKKMISLAVLFAGLVITPVAYAASATVDAPTQAGGVESTAGGGAPAGDVAEVQCNMLLGLKVAKAGTADLKAVTFQIPAGHAGALDVYYPMIDNYEQVLRVGGDIASVHVCDTPAGQMIRYLTNFNDAGGARALLPVNVGDGFQVLLVDGNHAFHAAIYTGAEDVLDFGN